MDAEGKDELREKQYLELRQLGAIEASERRYVNQKPKQAGRG